MLFPKTTELRSHCQDSNPGASDPESFPVQPSTSLEVVARDHVWAHEDLCACLRPAVTGAENEQCAGGVQEQPTGPMKALLKAELGPRSLVGAE